MGYCTGRPGVGVKCISETETRYFKSMTAAGEWLVKNGEAASVNAAKVAITHAVNGKQHYYGKDWSCNSAYGRKWERL